jgi:hypothetical protein
MLYSRFQRLLSLVQCALWFIIALPVHPITYLQVGGWAGCGHILYKIYTDHAAWMGLFLVLLDQRSMWTIAITWRPSSVNFSHFSSFFSSTTRPIGTKLSRNVHWMVLYKVYVFRSSLIFNMATRAKNMLWLAEISSLKLMNWLNPKCNRMIIGMSYSIFLVCMPIGNSRWPPPQDIY